MQGSLNVREGGAVWGGDARGVTGLVLANERAERSGWEWFTPRGVIGGRGFADERNGWVGDDGGMHSRER